MVKGIQKRVVVLKSPDRRIFEEAIFIMREDALKSAGVSAEDILNEACRIASAYMRRSRMRRKFPRDWILPAALFITAAGVAAAGIILFA